MLKHTFAGLALFFASIPATAQDGHADPAKAQFAIIAAWEGHWKVAETDALTIVFETTARGSTVVERWETASGLHSMTIYHLDGDRIIATHYCPQGNQPRLESHGTSARKVHFTFRDITDLDAGESHTQELSFEVLTDGAIRRSEIYRSEEGLGEPSYYTLHRVNTAD